MRSFVIEFVVLLCYILWMFWSPDFGQNTTVDILYQEQHNGQSIGTNVQWTCHLIDPALISLVRGDQLAHQSDHPCQVLLVK